MAKVVNGKKMSAMLKTNYKCAHCGRAGADLTVEHILPQSMFEGNLYKDNEFNLTALCVECNATKQNMLIPPGKFKEYYKYIADIYIDKYYEFYIDRLFDLTRDYQANMVRLVDDRNRVNVGKLVLEKAKKDFEREKEEIRQKGAPEHQKEKEYFKARIADMMLDAQKRNAENSKLGKEINRVCRDNQKVKIENKELKAEIKELKAQIHEQEKRLSVAEKTVERLKKTIHEMFVSIKTHRGG